MGWGVLAGDMWGWRCCGAGASAHYLADGWGVRLACGVYVLLDLGACGALFVCATGGGRLLLPFRGMELGVGDALCYIDVSVRFDSLSLLFSGHDFFFFFGGGGGGPGYPCFLN